MSEPETDRLLNETVAEAKQWLAKRLREDAELIHAERLLLRLIVAAGWLTLDRPAGPDQQEDDDGI